MMSLAVIEQLNLEASERAQESGDVPVLITEMAIERLKSGDLGAMQRMPYIGGYVPDGFERETVESQHGVYDGDNEGFGAYFVDATGCGSEHEPALTVGQFIEALVPDRYYALIETGQFQVKVGAFTK